MASDLVGERLVPFQNLSVLIHYETVTDQGAKVALIYP